MVGRQTAAPGSPPDSFYCRIRNSKNFHAMEQLSAEPKPKAQGEREVYNEVHALRVREQDEWSGKQFFHTHEFKY